MSNCSIGEQKDTKGWLHEHLTTFVQPLLGFIPTESDLPPFFKPEEIALVKNSWRAVKAGVPKGCDLVLLGRDVWIYHVLAVREKYAHTFDPKVSRATAYNYRFENSFVFDTGFAGTIPRTVKARGFAMLSSDVHVRKTQVFPMLTGARKLALKIEATPKYWDSGRMNYNYLPTEGLIPVKQDYASRLEFARAAILTIQIYKDSTPSFVDKKQPIGKGVDYDDYAHGPYCSCEYCMKVRDYRITLHNQPKGQINA